MNKEMKWLIFFDAKIVPGMIVRIKNLVFLNFDHSPEAIKKF